MGISRRVVAWAIGCTLGVALCGCGPTESFRPNLLLITVDALRADWLGCYGGVADLGAEACALGETGSRYVWAFSTASTGASSAASLLTSQPPSAHGVDATAVSFLREEAETLAERLRSHGYATAAFISSPELNRSRNFGQGFDLYDDRHAAHTPSPGPGLVEAALAWSTRAKQPWLVWIHFSDPHDLATREEDGDPDSTPRERQAQSIRQLDRKLSQLIAVMDARPRPPAVLLVAIHGQALGGAEGPAGHGHSLALEQIRVPLLWRSARAGPGHSVGRRVTTPVSLIDVAPTLLEAGGVAQPPSFWGQVLPYADLPAAELDSQPLRTIVAERAGERALIRGNEYVRMPLDGSFLASGSAGESARLWPPGERSGERLPELDVGAVRAERVSRLGAELRGPPTGGAPPPATAPLETKAKIDPAPAETAEQPLP